MTEDNKIEIDLGVELKSFKEHLETLNNNRILFSGRFGIGKTYFLKKFFGKNSERYNVFHLYPVNYQVSQNEDIFEYIKVDIARMLLSSNYKYDSEQTKHFTESCIKYFAKKGFKLGALFVEGLITSKIGSTRLDEVKSVIGNLINLKDDLEKESNQNNPIFELSNYLNEINYNQGSIYENDIITQSIKQMLNLIKDTDKKENVLIIDDLDRVDPEHVFRLLNVFSAHMDQQDQNSNKFGFDKIIIVCDAENIRNIFHTKYGSDTDFSGYLDKFYSNNVYEFSNKKLLQKELKDVFHELKNKYTDIAVIPVIEFILTELIHFNLFTPRHYVKFANLVSKENFNFIEIQGIIHFKNFSDSYHSESAFKIYSVLLKIFGSRSNLDKTIQILFNSDFRNIDDSDISHNPLIHRIIILLALAFKNKEILELPCIKIRSSLYSISASNKRLEKTSSEFNDLVEFSSYNDIWLALKDKISISYQLFAQKSNY